MRTITCALVICLLFLCGCASVEARGGDSMVERTRDIQPPTTKTITIETFGRNPTPDEWAVLQQFGQTESKK